MENFRFEHTCHLSEVSYVNIQAGTLGLRKSRRFLRRALVLGMGVACLFWEYTLLLGIAMLGVAVVHMFVPRFLPATAARNYRQMNYLHGPVTYGVDDRELWLRGMDFECRCGWSLLSIWQERDPWLVLSVTGMPMIVLPIREMRIEGNTSTF
jgi:hypothetical protein